MHAGATAFQVALAYFSEFLRAKSLPELVGWRHGENIAVDGSARIAEIVSTTLKCFIRVATERIPVLSQSFVIDKSFVSLLGFLRNKILPLQFSPTQSFRAKRQP